MLTLVADRTDVQKKYYWHFKNVSFLYKIHLATLKININTCTTLYRTSKFQNISKKTDVSFKNILSIPSLQLHEYLAS